MTAVGEPGDDDAVVRLIQSTLQGVQLKGYVDNTVFRSHNDNTVFKSHNSF